MTLLDEYLTHTNENDEGVTRHSTLTLALWDARRTTGRDEASGKFHDPAAPNAMTWSAALVYLCILDQLGTVVEHVAPAADMLIELNRYGGQVERNFRRPLVQFSGLSADDASAQYALRNAFAHDYSLTNQNKRPELRRAFQLHGSPSSFVTHPSSPWNGSYADADTGDETKTSVSLRLLGDTVERVVAAITTANRQGLLQTSIADDELQARYFVVIRYGDS